MLATTNDVQLNMVGTVYACCGVLSTSYYQLFVKSKQQDLGLDAFQLLYYQAPISAGLVLFVSPLFDSPFGENGYLAFPYDTASLTAIGISCSLAFCVNLSIFLVIGNTSPISYNVLGHFKLTVILTSGWMMFGENMNTEKGFGVVMAVAGVIAYSFIKMNIPSGWDSRAKSPHVQQSQLSNSAAYAKIDVAVAHGEPESDEELDLDTSGSSLLK
jgi:solute carrier family 35, member E3